MSVVTVLLGAYVAMVGLNKFTAPSLVIAQRDPCCTEFVIVRRRLPSSKQSSCWQLYFISMLLYISYTHELLRTLNPPRNLTSTLPPLKQCCQEDGSPTKKSWHHSCALLCIYGGRGEVKILGWWMEKKRGSRITT